MAESMDLILEAEESEQLTDPEINIESDLNESTENSEPTNSKAPKKNAKPVKHVKFHISKIRSIMKTAADCSIIQQDAVFLVAKATELFVEYMATETGKQLANGKRKTLSKRDVDVTIESIPQLCFLDGALE